MERMAVLLMSLAWIAGCASASDHEGSISQSGKVCKGKRCRPVDMGVVTDMAVVDMQPACNHLASKELLKGLDSWYTAEVAANGNFLTVNDEGSVASCLQTQIWQPNGTVVGQVPNCANVGDASNAFYTIAAPDGWYAKVIIPEIDDACQGGAAYDYSVIHILADGTISGHVQNLDHCSNGIWYYLAGDKNAAYLIYSWSNGTFWRVFALEAGVMRYLKDVPYVADVMGRTTYTAFFVVDGALFADDYSYEDWGGGITRVRLNLRGVYPNSARRLAVADHFDNTGFERLKERVVSMGGSINALHAFVITENASSDMLFYDAQDQLVRTLRPKEWQIHQLAPIGAGRWIGTLTVSANNWAIEHGSHVFLYDDDGNVLDHLKFLNEGFGWLVNLKTSGANAVVGRNMASTKQVQNDGTVVTVGDSGFLHFSCAP